MAAGAGTRSGVRAQSAGAAGGRGSRVRSQSAGVAPTISRMDLARIAWLTTVFACLVAVLVLVIQGYLGYAAVTFAVAVAAAINLR